MIKELVVPMGNRPVADDQDSSLRGGMQSMLAGRRVGTVLLYTMSTLFLAVFCTIVFSTLELDTEFAIAVMGSLIGGFLGAMLAAALIVDMYLPKIRKEFRNLE